MSERIERLDYTKAPPGYHVDLHGDFAAAVSAAWTHYKREHDPPGMFVNVWVPTGPLPPGCQWGVHGMAGILGIELEADARAAAWAWHDRRHALAEHDKKRCSRAVPFSEYLAMTDADCKLAEFLVADAERRAELRRLSAMTMQSCSEEDPEVGALIEAHARDKAAQERYANP